MENYIELKTITPMVRSFCFVDDKACSATSLFFKHKVAVKRVSIMQNPLEKYQLVFCKIRSQDKKRFLDALKELPTKMNIIGNIDYEEKADHLIKYLKTKEES